MVITSCPFVCLTHHHLLFNRVIDRINTSTKYTFERVQFKELLLIFFCNVFESTFSSAKKVFIG